MIAIHSGISAGGKLRTTNIIAYSKSSSPYVYYLSMKSKKYFTILSDPATLPGGGVKQITCTSDGIYIAAAQQTVSPYIVIYKRSNYKITKLSNPGTLPPSSVTLCKFSPNGNFLAVGSSASPYIVVYERSGDTFTKLTNPGTLPSGGLEAIAWQNDSARLVTWRSAEAVTYDVTSGSITLNTVNSINALTYAEANYSYNDAFCFIQSQNNVIAYSNTAGVLAVLASTSTGNTFNVPGMAVSNNSHHVFLGTGSTLQLTPLLYNAGANTWSEGTAVAYTTAGTSSSLPRKGVAISNDNTFIAMVGESSSNKALLPASNASGTLTAITPLYGGFTIGTSSSASVCIGTQVN